MTQNSLWMSANCRKMKAETEQRKNVHESSKCSKAKHASNLTTRIKLIASRNNNKALDMRVPEDKIHTKTRNTSMFFCTRKIILSPFPALLQFVVIQEYTSNLMIQFPVVVAPKSCHGRRIQQFPVT
jgi:hypothetical protein